MRTHTSETVLRNGIARKYSTANSMSELADWGDRKYMGIPKLDASIRICPFLSFLELSQFSGIFQFVLLLLVPLSQLVKKAYRDIPERVGNIIDNGPEVKRTFPA